VVICHYGDPWWVKYSLIHNKFLSDNSVLEVILIDNSGNLNAIDFVGLGKVTLLPAFPTPPGRVQHAYALNMITRTRTFSSDYIIILDSDVMAIKENWLPSILSESSSQHIPILVLQENSGCLTHSCFIVIPVYLLSKMVIYFERGISVLKFDTARLIGLSMLEKGENFLLSSPVPTFGKIVGYKYFDSFIHITSVSVRQMPTRKFNSRKQLSKLRNNVLKEVALNAKRLHFFDSRLGLFLILLKTVLPRYRRYSHVFLDLK